MRKSLWDASIMVTRLQAPTAGGVTSFQAPPSSIVSCTRPSSVPAHTCGLSTGEGASVYTTPRLPFRSSMAAVVGSSEAGTPGAGRVRSSEMRVQLMPPSIVL
ncbi:MAG: hypothetical protein R2745_16150 [Vicinamibacterales bacterium]